jgi:hypothetical protein
MALFPLKFKEVKSLLLADTPLEQIHGEMVRLLDDESSNHHRLGQCYNSVVDRKLAENAGYKNAQEYFAKNLKGVSLAALRLYGAVAAGFSEEATRKLGVTCLSLLLTYKEVADIQVNHEQAGDTVIEVPDKKGVVTNKTLAECSVDEMRRAIQRKRKPTSSKPLPEGDRARADQLGTAVTSRFEQGDPVRVQVRNHKGTTVLDYNGIPLGKERMLAEALLAAADAQEKN